MAMIARIALMPLQVLSFPVFWQFVADTLPEMVYASAWLLLATFVVQLVGIAMGLGTNTAPGTVIETTVGIRRQDRIESNRKRILLMSFVCILTSLLP